MACRYCRRQANTWNVTASDHMLLLQTCLCLLLSWFLDFVINFVNVLFYEPTSSITLRAITLAASIER
jgi:hypothetical protein